MAPSHTTKVAILGAGKGGTALLDLLHQVPGIVIVGITDKNPLAPGLQRARDLNIPVTDGVRDLIANHGVGLILDVTGDPEMERFVLAHKGPGAEVLSGAVARLLWTLIQHQTNLQAELFHAEKLAGVGSFAAGIAHDINNPLQLILGLAENLLEEQDPAIVREHARDIIQAVHRTSAICRDLTRYARRSVGEESARVNLNVKLDEALKIARHAVAFQDITVVRRYAPEPIVTGNPDELLHVFVNLISNAVQAMEQGGTLTLRTGRENGVMTASVSDTGCGIPQDLIGRIFEPFFTTKPPGKGTGLGLYNAKAVVTRLHGKIHVDSRVGAGSTFRIELPPTEPAPPENGP